MPGGGFCVHTRMHEIRLEADGCALSPSLSCDALGDGRELVRLRLHAEHPVEPVPIRLVFRHPSIAVHGRWHPSVLHSRHLPPDWAGGLTSELARHAPVLCLYDNDGTNRLTLAGSDAVNPIEFRAGVQEESGEIRCRIHLFERAHPPISDYEFCLLIDTRPVAYHRAIQDVERWWRSMPGFEPRGVPEFARLPMYSTWYSFHQNIEPAAVLKQCRIARSLGCETVIVDDGWQTSDSRRGYAYAGDWEPERIGAMKEFVGDVHEAGMKFMLWYALPFVGRGSRAIRRFEGKLLTYLEHLHAGVLDPRYPEVREHLVSTLEGAMHAWNLDGFKLDFVDEFAVRGGQPCAHRPGMDHASVTAAGYRLLEDTFDRLHGRRDDLAIEFRQEYIGPLMRRFGNMLRAGDCPNDGLSNRVRTLDIRLLCGNTACHSDMLMWHSGDSVESAALQLLNVLFAVPQISVLLDRLPAEHLAMLRFWMSFWREYRHVLLDGELCPLHPETLYPVVIAGTAGQRVAVVYQEMVIDPGADVPAELLIVNAKRTSQVVISTAQDAGRRVVDVFDCQGAAVSSADLDLRRGVHALQIPPAGLARLVRD